VKHLLISRAPPECVPTIVHQIGRGRIFIGEREPHDEKCCLWSSDRVRLGRKKLGEGSAWRGPTATFVLHWQNQVRLCETQVESTEYFSNGQKKHMLQNAVHPDQELCAVKTQADQHKTQNGTDLTCDQYVNLLLAAASAYDTQFAPKTHFAARAPRCAVYSHNITASNDDNDIDCALDVIQANGHSTRPAGTSMALSQWTQLSQDAKEIWKNSQTR
jgi:hypothetical protein